MSDLQTFEYQPTDDNDFPIGAKQVFKFVDDSDLRDQLVRSNVHLLRKLRQVTKENRLATFKQDKPTEVEPMTDEDVRTSLFALRAERAAENFVRLTPEYYKCQENVESIFAWIVKNGLSPIDTESYQLAYQDLSADNLLILGPQIIKPAIPVSVPLPVPVVETVPFELPALEHVVETIPGYHPEPIKPVAQVVPEPRAVPGVGGLNRGVADSGGEYRPSSVASDVSYTLVQRAYNDKNELVVTGSQTLYGKQALDAMPQEEYKRRLTKEPGFATKVDKIESEFKQSRLEARRAAMGRL